MSGSTNGSSHIDYREAFVLDMEIAAHGPTCKQCILAALHSRPDDFCDRMKHMRKTIQRAYEALPKYYKDRYTQALTTVLEEHNQIIKGYAGGR